MANILGNSKWSEIIFFQTSKIADVFLLNDQRFRAYKLAKKDGAMPACYCESFSAVLQLLDLQQNRIAI